MKTTILAILAINIGFITPSFAEIASHYGNNPGEGGPLTANGERYNPNGLTAAHRTLSFGTKVRVTSCRTGRSVVVRINDRGPFIKGRHIDLSNGAARVIGLNGVECVKLSIK
jgi:rare lipoprotein A